MQNDECRMQNEEWESLKAPGDGSKIGTEPQKIALDYFPPQDERDNDQWSELDERSSQPISSIVLIWFGITFILCGLVAAFVFFGKIF
jgi:hypothetical protein